MSISTPSEDNDLVLTAEFDSTHDCCYMSSASLMPQAPATVKLTLDWKQQRGDKRREHLVSGVMQREGSHDDKESFLSVHSCFTFSITGSLLIQTLFFPTQQGRATQYWSGGYKATLNDDHRPSCSAGTAVKKR